MKKLTALFLSVLLVTGLVSCGDAKSDSEGSLWAP